MSRGPGRIERAIRALFDANPDRAFTTDELVVHCYLDCWPIEKKHRVAVLRAAHAVCRRDPDWRAIEGRGDRNAGQYFVNMNSLKSYAHGTVFERRDWRWLSADALQLALNDDRFQPGGRGWRAVEMHRAKRDGDTARLAELEAEKESA